MRDAYENYDFSRAYHAIYNFCVIDMSNFYMDVIKDRLYCADDQARRCAQTALYRILVDCYPAAGAHPLLHQPGDLELCSQAARHEGVCGL